MDASIAIILNYIQLEERSEKDHANCIPVFVLPEGANYLQLESQKARLAQVTPI